MATATKKVTKSKEKSANGVQINYIKYGVEIIGTEGDDGIIGTADNDRIYAKGGNDKIMAGAGNDTIDGGAGNNTFVFEVGDGNDTVVNGVGNDTLFFHPEQSNLEFVQNMSNLNLVINYGNNDSVTLKDYYRNDQVVNGNTGTWMLSDNNHSVKTIKNGNTTQSIHDAIDSYGLKILGTDGVDAISGTNGSDRIFAGGGNDQIVAFGGDDYLDGGYGNDTYILYGNTHGNKTIANGSGNDSVQLLNGTFDLRFSRDMNNNDLKCSYHYTNSANVIDSFTLQGYYTTGSHAVKQIQNNLTMYNTVDEAINQWGMDIVGTNGYDTITGSAADDMIYAGNGNDKITGGQGNDILDGGVGSDFYYFSSGDGHDTILNNLEYGKDAIIFMDQQDLSLSRSAANKDLVISYGNNDSVTLKDYYSGPYHAVKYLKNGENSQYEAIGNVVNEHEVIYNGTSGNDYFKVSLADRTRIVDAGGNDILRLAQDANTTNGVRVLFNVDNTGNIISDVNVISANQLVNWINGNEVTGVKIENNAVETIQANGQQITSTDIAQLASDVAGWLNTNGYASVQDVLDTNNQSDIHNLMATFVNNTNWQ